MEAAVPAVMTERDPLRWKALTVVCAAFFMTILDVSIVNVALPSIGKSLHFSRDNLQWVITAYAITYGGFLLLAGRIADFYGRRRVFMIGVVVFTLASLFCGLAWSEGVLIASRAVQGVGAAVITPSALSIVMTTFEEGAERNKALGIWGALGGGGAAVGVLLGGILTTYAGWEWIFFINVPVGALAFVLSPRFVRESSVEGRKSLDVAGAITVTAGLGLLVFAVTKAPDHGWSSGWTLSRLAAAGILLIAFVVIEARQKDPLMPFHIFRIQTVAGANVSGLLLGAVTFANFFVLTLYVQQVLGYSAIRTGLTFVVTAGSAVLWAGLAQAMTTRFGVKPMLAIGFLAMIAASIYYTQVSPSGSFASELLPGYLLMGFALPFTFIPVSIAALAGVSYDEAGLASGLINTAQQIGGAVGIAVCSSVLFSAAAFVTASGASNAFWVLVGISVAALISTLVLIKNEQIAPETQSSPGPA
ncbi:MAG TPA: DHA2 family efflux MFS transporter permease subunit [Gaiellaceae bacterium]|nr:DHA2 family efflux MFS transporter permease subunit [Gaiellaceae bacterium]